MAKKKKSKEAPPSPIYKTASRLYTILKAYNKLQQPIDDKEIVVAALEREIVAKQRRRGLTTRGRTVSASTIAIALAHNSGCGSSLTALARAFEPKKNHTNAQIQLIADRLITNADRWTPEPIDEDALGSSISMAPPYVEPASTASSSTSPSMASPDLSQRRRSKRRQDGGVEGNAAAAAPPQVAPAPVKADDTAHCTLCDQPPLGCSSFWRDFSGTDLASCPTCPACSLPRMPQSFEDVVEMINQEHGELGGKAGYDEGRVGVPRPHEHALFRKGTSDEAVQAMAELLRERQKSLPHHLIVERSTNPDAQLEATKQPQAIQVECIGPCGKHRNFDWLFGSFERIRRNEEFGGRGSKYLSKASIVDFKTRVVPELATALSGSREAPLPKLKWFCCNCESGAGFAETRHKSRQAEKACSTRLGLRDADGKPGKRRGDSAKLLISSVPLGAPLTLEAGDIPSIQGGDETEWRFDDFAPSAGVLIVRREAVESKIAVNKAELAELIGAPSVQGLFSKAASSIGDVESTRACAGGASVEMALLLLAPGAIIDRLMSISNPAERSSSLKDELTRESSGCEAIAVAFMDGNLPDADEVAAERDAFFKQRRAENIGGDDIKAAKCETGRPGPIESWAALVRNPDIIRYCRMASVAGGRQHTDHMLYISDPSGRMLHGLFMYPAGPSGRAQPFLSAEQKRFDGKETTAAKNERERLKRKRDQEDAQRIAHGRQPTSLRLPEHQATTEDSKAKLNQRRLCYGQPRACEVSE